MAVAGVFICLGALGAYEDALPDAVAKARSSLCFIQTRVAGEPVRYGSGFVAAVRNNRTFILTAEHVVRGGHETAIATLNPGLPGQSDIPARVVCTDPVNDLALLEIGACEVPALPIQNDFPKPGEPLYMAGFPGAKVVRIPRVEPALALELAEPDCWRAHGVGKPGLSGGAVLNRDGKVVGVAVSSNYSVAMPGQSDLLQTYFSTHAPILKMLSLPFQRIDCIENDNENGSAHYTLSIPLGLHAGELFSAQGRTQIARLVHAQTGAIIGGKETHYVRWPDVKSQFHIERGNLLVDLNLRGDSRYSVDLEIEMELCDSAGKVRYRVFHAFNADLPAGLSGDQPSKKRKKKRSR